ncbi:MAG TPA: prepilin-type N-terminal cleavage/methylation domain-containing protein [Phycisphaerae bacterium]|nr:prepilin-type N-terminal cleavage/methylation domain-containing protein [Phycisphaerae bacterium]
MGRKAFTLVEVLIVVVILGILAAIVLPRFSNASAVARASMLADDLRIFRMQLQVFKSQHRDIVPGYPVGAAGPPTEPLFIDQMTRSSKENRQTADPNTAGYPYGPYLQEIPVDPVNGKTSVQIVGDGQNFPNQADDSDGWIYQPSTMTFRADCIGSDSEARSYFGY